MNSLNQFEDCVIEDEKSSITMTYILLKEEKYLFKHESYLYIVTPKLEKFHANLAERSRGTLKNTASLLDNHYSSLIGKDCRLVDTMIGAHVIHHKIVFASFENAYKKDGNRVIAYIYLRYKVYNETVNEFTTFREEFKQHYHLVRAI